MSAKQIVDRVWEAMESDDFDALEGLVHPDGVDFSGLGIQLTTAAELRAFVEGYKAGFPDLAHEVVGYVESRDAIALELRVTGTHQGTLRGQQGEIPPTGREVVWQSSDHVEIRDGKVARWHVYTDQLAFLSQLGLMPDPAAQAA
jgi:predicted ester cyclase